MNSMPGQTFGHDRPSETSPAMTVGEERRIQRPLAGKLGRGSRPEPAFPEECVEGEFAERGLERRPSGANASVSWQELEAQADRPEVQEVIRKGIRTRMIRVATRSGGGIRILAGDPPLSSC
jgi:hypothetical protein